MARRKAPKRSSCIGIVRFCSWVLFPAVSWGKASDFCVYVGRLSPKTTRCPSKICSEMSFVFTPGISNTTVRTDSAGSSIKSILEKKKLAKEWKKRKVYILTYRGVYSEGVDDVGRGATARSLPDFMASKHLRFAARLTARTKAGCRDASKIWWSVIWCRCELIVERKRRRRGYLGCNWMWSDSLPLYLLSQHVMELQFNLWRRCGWPSILPECSSWKIDRFADQIR